MTLQKGEYFGSSPLRLEREGLGCSATEYQPLQEQPWHTHEHPTLFIHLAGDLYDRCARDEWRLPTLGITYHPSSSAHRTSVGLRGARGINLDFSEEWLARHGIAPRDLGSHRVLTGHSIKMAALRLIRFYRETPFDCRDSVLELLEALEEREMSTERVAPKWLKHVEGQIQERFADSLSLSSLALDAGVHPTHLARVYRLRYGASVTDKIQTLRTEYASERILEGASIGEAAALAGFSDQFHFSRMLKRRFGYSPSTLKQLTCGNRS